VGPWSLPIASGNSYSQKDKKKDKVKTRQRKPGVTHKLLKKYPVSWPSRLLLKQLNLFEISQEIYKLDMNKSITGRPLSAATNFLWTNFQRKPLYGELWLI